MSDQEKMKVIELYNKVRSSMTLDEFHESIQELPPCITFYIIPLKQADIDSDVEKIKDYLIWREYFMEVPVLDPEKAKIKEEFYHAMYKKHISDDVNTKNELTLLTSELTNKIKTYCKTNGRTI